MECILFTALGEQEARSGWKETIVNRESESPFDNLESAHEYLSLLLDSIEEARKEVAAQALLPAHDEPERRTQALQLVSYQLTKLSFHTASSRRILNDLKMLRRLLLQETPADIDPAGDPAGS